MWTVNHATRIALPLSCPCQSPSQSFRVACSVHHFILGPTPGPPPLPFLTILDLVPFPVRSSLSFSSPPYVCRNHASILSILPQRSSPSASTHALNLSSSSATSSILPFPSLSLPVLCPFCSTSSLLPSACNQINTTARLPMSPVARPLCPSACPIRRHCSIYRHIYCAVVCVVCVACCAVVVSSAVTC